MIAVADINTLWRIKPFEALAHSTPVLGLAPHRWGCPPARNREDSTLPIRPVALPPGWASTLAFWTSVRLRRIAGREVRKAGQALDAVVVTSPHYLPLVHWMRREVPVFYYCSDDYAGYEGWGGHALLGREARLVRSAAHSFFVSQPLAERAVTHYGADPSSVSVCPNATDESFLRDIPTSEIDHLLSEFPSLHRPLLGVVGGVNDRLDFQLLRQCADLPQTGSLVFVGGVDPACDDADLQSLQAHPKVVFTGQRPHAELPGWMQALDAALIPYRPTPLNHACSPMRLFDHLAAGRPVIATTACAQVREFSDWVRACSTPAAFVQELDRVLAHAPGSGAAMRDFARKAHLWTHRAQQLARVVAPNARVARPEPA